MMVKGPIKIAVNIDLNSVSDKDNKLFPITSFAILLLGFNYIPFYNEQKFNFKYSIYMCYFNSYSLQFIKNY